jgi:hypothetical protein
MICSKIIWQSKVAAEDVQHVSHFKKDLLMPDKKTKLISK